MKGNGSFVFRQIHVPPAFVRAVVGFAREPVLIPRMAVAGSDELARYMGTSVEMIERTCGHLVTGADDAFRSRLDVYGKLAEPIESEEAR